MYAAAGSFEEDFAGFVRRGRIGPGARDERPAARPRVEEVLPQPLWQFEAPALIRRFDATVLSVRTCQIAGGELRLGGHVQALEASASGEWQSITLAIPSESVGDLMACLTLRALDGSQQQHDLRVVVHPRAANCNVEQLADGSVAFSIAGAEPVALAVPSRSLVQMLHTSAGVLHHGYLTPTLLEITYRDDLRTLQTYAVVLDGKAPTWGPLPTMRPLQWTPS